MFVGPGAKHGFLNQHTNQQAKRAKQAKQDEGASDADDSGDEPANAGTDDILKSMLLSDLAVSGMQLIEKSADYKTLFGDEPGQLTAFDIRKLEMRLELFLWDRGLGWECVVAFFWAKQTNKPTNKHDSRIIPTKRLHNRRATLWNKETNETNQDV